MINFWSYKDEYNKYRLQFNKFFDQTLKGGLIFFGPNLKNFENNFIKKYKSKYGVAVGSGTDALLISLMAINIKKGDEVITASNTAIPTISAIVNSGAKPILVDINNDYLIDINSIEEKIAAGLLVKQNLFDGVLSNSSGTNMVDSGPGIRLNGFVSPPIRII